MRVDKVCQTRAIHGSKIDWNTVRRKLTIEHDRRYVKGLVFDYLANVTCLFLELADGTCFWSFVGVHQASRHLDDGLIDRRSVLLLQQDAGLGIRVRRILKNSSNPNAINIGTLWSGEAFC
jgi:hypothetical protein